MHTRNSTISLLVTLAALCGLFTWYARAQSNVGGGAAGTSGTVTALTCGVAGTTSCVITGAGSTSGSATLTWPAVAGTATNPVTSSNAIALPAGTNCTAPALTFGGDTTSGFIQHGSTVVTFCGNSTDGLAMYSAGLRVPSAAGYQFSNSSSSTATADTGLGRASAGVLTVDTGTIGNFAGTIKASGFNAAGTAGISAGSFTAVTAIASTDGLITTLTGTSDVRLKTNIHPFSRGVADLMRLHPARYHWNAKGQEITKFGPDVEQVGFTAQDVREAIPEAVGSEKHDGTDYLTISDRPILALLVNAVKQQQEEIERLKRELAELKATQATH
jgi:Chaperone of endosialidase